MATFGFSRSGQLLFPAPRSSTFIATKFPEPHGRDPILKFMNNLKYFLSHFCATVCGVAHGGVITFDDLPASTYGSPGNGPAVPNGYQGLNWSELYVLNTIGYPTSGYVNGTVSPNNIVY